MSMQPLSSSSTARKRSRSGCFICRVRKVKCDAAHGPVEPSKRVYGECLNCRRLGFECRWQAPAAGEAYNPPPKRRRTAGHRPDSQVGTNATDDGTNQTPGTWPNDSQRPERNSESFASTASAAAFSDYISLPMQSNSQRNNGNPDADTGINAITEEPDFTLVSRYMDPNLGTEGFDFIPLPSIDISALPMYVDASQSDALGHWPLMNPDDFWVQPNSISNSDQPSSPSVNESNRRLVHHYLEVMKGYSKVDATKDADNLFITAFNQSLCFPPLFHAILAFSAAHMSIQDPSFAEEALRLNQLAQRSIDSFRQNYSIEVEGLLSALFVRAKRIHVMGERLELFLAVITEAADIISTEHGKTALQDSSNLASRIILRLAILDARAGCYRLGGGLLINRLRSMTFLPDVFDAGGSPEHCASLGPIYSLLRANLFRFRVAELDLQLHKQMNSRFLASPPLQTSSFVSLQAETRSEISWWEQRLQSYGVEPHGVSAQRHKALDSRTFACYAVLSALHSTLLYLDRIFPLPGFDRALSTTNIFRYQLQVCRDRSRSKTPSSLSPSSLLLAALSTTDPIHRDWVLEVLLKGEEWGLYVRKMRLLLEDMFQREESEAAIGISDAMDQVTGKFLI